MVTAKFQKLIRDYYENNRRSFPWRKTRDGYKILVSEIMLQQTQTDRVVPKYENFLEKFPDFNTLAKATNSEVLKEWKGLGYNRRALNLKKAAEMVALHFGGKLPKDLDTLDSLPGIGPYTAGALTAFVYNTPAVFIETNIRTVYTHFFFENQKKVSDKELLLKIAETLPESKKQKSIKRKNRTIRDWYYALMDYGVMLKKSGVKINAKSIHYTKQTPFKGSNREIRSKVLQTVLEHQPIVEKTIIKKTEIPKEVVRLCLTTLEKEGFLKKTKPGFVIA